MPAREQELQGQQAEPAAHRLVVADELGMLKVVQVPAGPKWEDASVVATWGKPDRAGRVVALCAAVPAGLEAGAPSLLAVGRAGGRVELLDGATGAALAAWQAAAGGQQRAAASARDAGAGVVGLHCLGGGSGWGQASSAAELTVGLRVLSVTGGGRTCIHARAQGEDVAQWEEVAGFQAAPSVAATALSSDCAALAVGGEGCQLSLWDVAAQTRAWQAKGAKPNAIGLVDHPYVTAAAFLSDWAGRGGSDGEVGACSMGRRVVVVGNTSHKLLIYDTAAGRRPQLEVAWRDARITALVADGDQRVWAANGAGAVEALDLRAGRMTGGLKGAGGSVRALALHPGGQPLIASAGLDRFVRVHSTDSRANLGRAYVKQQLTAVAWLPPLAVAPGAAAAAAADTKGAAREGLQRSRGGRTPSQPVGDDSDAAASDGSSSDEGGKRGGSRKGGGGGSGSSSDSDDEGAGRHGQRLKLGGGRGGGRSGGKRKGGRGKGGRGSKKARA
ncbi:hypothetical protein Rsub_12342 [Raphidocelis subcapitata]|uniref:WD repeat-containing 74 n=1 Tax=Raphidocelis subcapitata TaxID=307507 RepID=A0A2V0PIH8_9CHLO|nr:hypothetical protein Rsub_12342 [Raphidocelis subcapitata]|eukprot:GBF99536.1 hypothetical protein Rsub_12342 [Raphidocelis subcapitata]